MGAYLCIASNGVPPSVSKRLKLIVHCAFIFFKLIFYSNYYVYKLHIILLIIFIFSFFSVPPMITIPNQLVGAVLGQNLTLECISEAFPKSINYWTRNGEIVTAGNYSFKTYMSVVEGRTNWQNAFFFPFKGVRHEPSVYDKDYTITMRLHIRNVQKVDFTSYKCVSKNNLGETDGLIQVEGMYYFPYHSITEFVWTATAK